MSKPISSYPESMRVQVVENRLKNKTLGLGYWAALDYLPALRRKQEKKGKNGSKADSA